MLYQVIAVISACRIQTSQRAGQAYRPVVLKLLIGFCSDAKVAAADAVSFTSPAGGISLVLLC